MRFAVDSWIAFCAIALLATGCATTNGPGANSEESGHSPAALTQTLSLHDSFDNGRLAAFWAAGGHGSGRYETGAVSISSMFSKSSPGSVLITVRKGDIAQQGGDGFDTERAELDSGKHPFLGAVVRYKLSFLLPEGFPIVDDRLVIAQWKQNGVLGNPLVAQRFRAGRHYLTIRDVTAGPSDRKEFDLPKIAFGRWISMTYAIKFSHDTDGFVRVSMNGHEVVSYNGPTAIASGQNSFYNKIGLYRDQWPDPMTIYFDDYSLTVEAE